MLTLEMAGLRIRIENEYDDVRQLCRDYLVPGQGKPDLSVRVMPDELQEQLDKLPGCFPGKGYAESVLIYEKISNALPAFNAFVLHASAVMVRGEAYVFAAGCGTGKSTHTGYWREILGDRMTVINGDKPICRFSEDGQLMVFGTPWNGKENWGTNISAPMRALCLLERGKENAVFPVEASKAFGELCGHFHLTDPEKIDLPKLFELVERMMKMIPIYRLKCRKDVSAAELAIRTLLRGNMPQDRKTVKE